MADIGNTNVKDLVALVNQAIATLDLVKAYLERDIENNPEIRENKSESDVGVIRF